jgi:transcriptional regulator with XRE-family HTH domain
MARVKNVKSNFSINMGRKIAVQRMALGMSRTQAVEGLGISHQQLEKYESAKDRITCEMITKIAKVLKLPVMYFFDDIEREPTPQPDYQEKMALYVARNFRKIKHPDVQEGISKMISTLAKAG